MNTNMAQKIKIKDMSTKALSFKAQPKRANTKLNRNIAPRKPRTGFRVVRGYVVTDVSVILVSTT